ncbi:YaiI/YqxD family protein [Neisseriaceae bacterium JH1-16]|nr:YaiI/YqxD family protein [Neisseriaceae bacterium JH1-16]
MKIWVDADACPAAVKDMLFRAADREQVAVTLVANKLLRTPPSQWVNAVQVANGFDVADGYIAHQVQHGDLVVTGDVPLAALVVEAGGEALNPRGERYTADTIRAALTMRNFLTELRDSGVATGGPPPFGQRERQAFARELDGWLLRRSRAKPPLARSVR